MSPATRRRSLVYLTGFMGSGKSTVGPILANTLGFEFTDIDRTIEEMAQKPIVEIFSTEGEQVFRNLERKALEGVAHREQCVVSLGGGTIANDANFQVIRSSGIIVYLKLSPEEILERVRNRPDRPMLKDEHGNMLGPKELEQRVLELLDRREKYYAGADIVVIGDNRHVGATVDDIVRRLRPLI